MSANTEISWTDNTFNPIWGCTKVSPGCDHCYAATFANRFGVKWGPDAERRQFGDKHWNEPLKWNKAAATGVRKRVFCASMADWCDPDWPAGTRERLFDLIRRTPSLDWLMLTKRPNLLHKCLPSDWGNGYPNVWLMTTVESQDYAWRIEELLKWPAVVRGLSCEPLLGPLDIRDVLEEDGFESGGPAGWVSTRAHGIDWVIAGGESGPGARPAHPDWFRSLRDQCAAAGVAYHFKQWGEWSPVPTEHRYRELFTIHGTAVGLMPDGSISTVGSTAMKRVGKKLAGRELDGRTWDEFPEVAA